MTACPSIYRRWLFSLMIGVTFLLTHTPVGFVGIAWAGIIWGNVEQQYEAACESGQNTTSKACIDICRRAEREGVFPNVSHAMRGTCQGILRSIEAGSLRYAKRCSKSSCIIKLMKSNGYRAAEFQITFDERHEGDVSIFPPISLHDPNGGTTRFAAYCGNCETMEYIDGPLRGTIITWIKNGIVVRVNRAELGE